MVILICPNRVIDVCKQNGEKERRVCRVCPTQRKGVPEGRLPLGFPSFPFLMVEANPPGKQQVARDVFGGDLQMPHPPPPFSHPRCLAAQMVPIAWANGPWRPGMCWRSPNTQALVGSPISGRFFGSSFGLSMKKTPRKGTNSQKRTRQAPKTWGKPDSLAGQSGGRRSGPAGRTAKS